MKDKKTITIVVPVYNVQRYLEKCLESLIKQTYREFEIILIDDGSTDACGSICDRYDNQYSYIKALHKTNGGLSDARNFAIPYIEGKYVTFVDSDDYVEPDFLEKFISAADSTGADIVIAGQFDETEDGKLLAKKGSGTGVGILTAEEALEKMCYEIEFGTSAWGKLFLSEYVRKFPFPKGKLYEDLATIYKMFGAAKKIAVLNQPLYHYVQRKGSIRNSSWNQNIMDVMDASAQLLDFICRNYPGIKEAGIQRYYFSANEVYIRAFTEKDYKKLVRPVQKRLREYWKYIKNNRKIAAKQKARYYMLAFFPGLYRLIRFTVKNRS